MRLSQSDLVTLRKRPQSTKLYLSIFQPTAIFKAQVNDVTITRTARVITFDTVSLGLYTYIQSGMTMWVGSTPGGNDLGKIRVRSATSTQITVSENSNVAWADNAYLTIFQYWELWPVYPHIILDPNNNENVIFYKDYDVAYTNQNSILGTFVNAGPHRAIMLDPASNQAQIFYSSTGSYNMLGDTLNYNWFFEGATVTGSSAATPGYITYNMPGHYVTRLSISGSSGGVDTTYRYVSVYNQANPPIQKWQLQSLQGSRDEGGYTASIKVFETIPIQEHAVIVIFGENYYGDAQQNIGGNALNSGDIFFVGYVDKDTIQYDYQHSEVSFDAMSITDIMKKSSGFSVSVKSVLAPTHWYELADMDSRRALYHYLRWHTTALNIADFQFMGDDRKIQFFDSDRGSMYDAVANYMQNTLIGQVVADRQSKVWAEVEARAYDNPTGSFSPIMDITKNDWVGMPSIDERLTPDVSYLEYGGVAYSGVNTGTFNPFIGSAPGDAPGFFGVVDGHEGLALTGQAQLNQLVGNIFANKNSPFPTVNLNMGINTSNLDIAPQEAIELHVRPDDTVRNLTIDGLYLPNSMSWKYEPRGLMNLPQIELKQLVSGYAGQSVTIPANPADFGAGTGGVSFSFPPLPDIFPSVSNPVGDGAPAKVLIHDTTAGLLYTQTFNTSAPVWYQVNGGLTPTQYQAINKIIICPNGAVYVGVFFDNTFTVGFLARADFVGGIFTVLLDQTAINAVGGGSSQLTAINFDPNYAERVAFVIRKPSGTPDPQFFFLGNNGTFVNTFTTSIGNVGSISTGLNQWLFITGGLYYVLDAGLSTILRSGAFGTYTTFDHIRVGTSGTTLIGDGDGGIYIGTNNCTTVTPKIIPTVRGYSRGWAIDASGSLIVSNSGVPNGTKSTDMGYSFSIIATLPVLQNWNFAFVSGDINASRWIGISNGGYIYYTNDFFVSNPYDKRGNVVQVSPIPFFDIVKVVP